jgi:hypothetical protein
MAPNNADAAAIADFYAMVIAEVKAAAMVYPAEDVQSYFNPTVYCKIPDGLNARGKFSCQLLSTLYLINLTFIFLFICRCG